MELLRNFVNQSVDTYYSTLAERKVRNAEKQFLTQLFYSLLDSDDFDYVVNTIQEHPDFVTRNNYQLFRHYCIWGKLKLAQYLYLNYTIFYGQEHYQYPSLYWYALCYGKGKNRYLGSVWLLTLEESKYIIDADYLEVSDVVHILENRQKHLKIVSKYLR